jgi:hypothetical protein
MINICIVGVKKCMVSFIMNEFLTNKGQKLSKSNGGNYDEVFIVMYFSFDFPWFIRC